MTLTIAENFALSTHLTEYPDTMTYDEVLNGIEHGHEDVVIWQPFEDDMTAEIVDSIDIMRVQFLTAVANMTRDLRDAIKQGDPMTIAEQLQSLENQLGA